MISAKISSKKIPNIGDHLYLKGNISETAGSSTVLVTQIWFDNVALTLKVALILCAVASDEGIRRL